VHAEALLVVEADTGKVLQADNATMPWYPASVTKIMTAYVTLKAVKEGRLTLDTLLTVSPVAASQSPSKMGFRPGIQVTVDNALKMMMVKSANDMAVVLAEGVGGSIDGFSAMMNQSAQKLGMTQTSYVNPNGLPADGQITSARDLAILARAVIRDLPEYEYFMHIPSIRYGRRVTQNFNKLIGRYPGADGFKTGFICASGYNLVASATRNGKRLIAVVLGSSSGQARAVRAAQLLERGFGGNGLGWLKPALGTVDNLVPIDASPPNLRDEMCGGKRKRPASDEDEDTTLASSGSAASGESPAMFFTSGLQPAMPKASEMLAGGPAASEPMVVYTGPKKTGPALIAAVAVDSEKQTPAKRGKKTRVAAHKPDAAAAPKADAVAKPA
jgi:D-alanyl-D-alanine carboxypeptidase